MLRAIRFQIAKDTSPERTKFIADYLAARKMVRFLLAVIQWPPFINLEAVGILILGMSRCVGIKDSQKLKALWWTKNEERYLKSYLRDVSVDYIRYQSSFGNVLRSLKHLPLRKLWQSYRVAKRLARRHSFVVAARAVETVVFFQYVKAINRENGFHFFSSTQSHPYFSALNELSRTKQIRLCFLAHSPWVLEALPIYCDLGVFWGPAGARQFTQCGSRFGAVTHFYPQSETKSDLIGSKNIALISLSKNPDWNSLRSLLLEIQEAFPTCRVLVRQHPNSLFDLPRDIQNYVSVGNLREELLRCKFMVAGNSTVHLEALFYGVPTFWAPELDGEQTFHDSYSPNVMAVNFARK